MTCSIDGCERKARVRGWCPAHYQRWWNHGDPTFTKHHNIGKTCSSDGCDGPARSAGLCSPCYDREWARRNPERAARNKKAWNERNPGANNAAAKAWRKRNRDHVRELRRARRMRERSAHGAHTEDEWRTRMAEWGGLCAYCLSAKAVERDHVMPISRGGSDDIDNILPACLPCNRSKSDRTLAEWLSVA